jgi:hypothetical protein
MESVWLGALCIALYLLSPSAGFAQEYPGNGGFLGVGVVSAAENGRLLRNLGANSGAVVTSVLQGGAAEEAGIRAGDVITRINDTYIRTPEDFLARMARVQPGGLVLVGAIRQGRLVKFMAYAQRRPEAATSQEPQSNSRWPLQPWWGQQNSTSVQSRTQGMGTGRCPVIGIIGDWAGEPMASLTRVIDVSLTLRPDGAYDYFAGQGNAAWITHTGVFQIADTGDQRYPCKITLIPDQNSIEISSKAHLFVLQSRDLMDDKPRTFLYKFFPTPTHLMLAGTWTDWRNDIGSFGLDRR